MSVVLNTLEDLETEARGKRDYTYISATDKVNIVDPSDQERGV